MTYINNHHTFCYRANLVLTTGPLHYISKEQLKKRLKVFSKNQYGQYIRSLL